MKTEKSKNVNLENKRGVFFQIGLIISLSLVLLAFEWTTERINHFDWNQLSRDDYMDETAEITIHKKKLPEMPKPKIIQIIEIVQNETEVDEVIDISSEVTDETVNDLEIIIDDESDIETEEPPPFTVVEKMPEFPGGYGAMQKFLADNIIYPRKAKEAGISGPVYIKFIVFEDGSINNAGIERGIGGGCDQEALRVVNIMPKWNPGLQRTKPVKVQMIMHVNFKLIN